MSTTFRADVATGLLAILDAFRAANPTLLRATFKARPPSPVNDLPYAYVNGRSETITHSNQIRRRVMRPEVIVVDALTDNVETVERFDLLVDALIDHFSASPAVTPNTHWDAMSVDDILEELPDGTYRAGVRFSFTNITAQEGRP